MGALHTRMRMIAADEMMKASLRALEDQPGPCPGCGTVCSVDGNVVSGDHEDGCRFPSYVRFFKLSSNRI